MPTLEWIGKNKVINHHQDVPFRVLDRKYSFNAEGQTDTDNNSKNMIIRGDNLEALKALLPQYEGKVKCIYIDPPYNTGNENWVYNDNVNDPKIKKWLGEVVGKEGEDLSRHDKWLCMMYPRLKLLYKLLADDGAIFISIDDNEQANLRLICDEIFGMTNFINNVIWEKNYSPRNDAKYFSASHDFIIVYTKTKEYWERKLMPRTDKQNKFYKYNDHDGRGIWRPDNVLVKSFSESGVFGICNPNTNINHFPPKGSCYRFNYTKSLELLQDNKIYFGKDGKGKPQLKRYLSEVNQGVVPQTLWKYEDVSHSQAGKKEVNSILSENAFDSPKPVLLLDRILQIATDKDDIILDSFAGSGTTAHAVLNMNKQDGGNRQFILVELEEYADSITAERVKRVIQGYDFTGEKKTEIYSQKLTSKNLPDGEKFINEAEEIIASESKKFDSISKPKIEDNHLKVIATKKYTDKMEGTGGDFSFYDLGETLLLPNGNLNEVVSTDRIREYVYFMETKESTPINKTSENKYYLGTSRDTAYYFYYEKNSITRLDHDFLSSITEKTDEYIIYADLCIITQQELKDYNITFKKIPRDMARL